MDQILRTAILWAMGSRNPAADCATLQRRRALPVIPPPSSTQNSSVLGRSFEDRVISDMMPKIAEKLGVKPPSSMCRLTRHVAHSGDFAIHFRGQIGLVELKNHARAVPLTDRRRFFDSLLINYRNIDWALLVTSRCSVPHFAEKGYAVVGRLMIDLPHHQKTLPVGFVCGVDLISLQAFEAAIITISQLPLASSPSWSMTDLLTRGEATRSHETSWGSANGEAFKHPVGAVFH